MTTNQLTYAQLVENARANRANEAIRERQTDIEADYKAASADKVRAEINAINKKLPYELQLTEAQIDELSQRATKEYIEGLATRYDKLGDESVMYASWTEPDRTRDRLTWKEMSSEERGDMIFNILSRAFDILSGGKHGSQGGDLFEKLIKASQGSTPPLEP